MQKKRHFCIKCLSVSITETSQLLEVCHGITQLTARPEIGADRYKKQNYLFFLKRVVFPGIAERLQRSSS